MSRRKKVLTKQLSSRIREDVFIKLKELAKKNNLSYNEYIRLIIDLHIEKAEFLDIK